MATLAWAAQVRATQAARELAERELLRSAIEPETRHPAPVMNRAARRRFKALLRRDSEPEE